MESVASLFSYVFGLGKAVDGSELDLGAGLKLPATAKRVRGIGWRTVEVEKQISPLRCSR